MYSSIDAYIGMIQGAAIHCLVTLVYSSTDTWPLLAFSFRSISSTTSLGLRIHNHENISRLMKKRNKFARKHAVNWDGHSEASEARLYTKLAIDTCSFLRVGLFLLFILSGWPPRACIARGSQRVQKDLIALSLSLFLSRSVSLVVSF
jgi:hypothetical protein